MKTRILCFTGLLLLTYAQAQTVAPAAHPGTPAQRASIVEAYGRLPLVFEANQGQTDPQVKFVSRGAGYNLFLTTTEAVLTLHRVSRQEPNSLTAKAQPQKEQSAVLRMKLVGANAETEVSGQNELPGKSNYFIGNDPKKWHTDVRQYAKVRYANVYPGVDLVYYGNQRELEYDFIVSPGANPHRIALDVRGAKRIRRDEDGELVLKVGEDEICWHKPIAYQEKDGTRQEIAAHYAITDTNRVGFEVGSYDVSRPLYIDPLIYSTYLGGSSADFGSSIAVDSAGNAYVAGFTFSSDFPISNPLQPTSGGYEDAFVAKINPAGSALVYSTYLGGSSRDLFLDIAVDGWGNAYVAGFTTSTDLPVTPGAFQTNFAGGYEDSLVAKLDPTGSDLVYSTYLGGGGSDAAVSVAVDSAGNAYVTGGTASSDFPTTPGAFQTSGSGGFVTKLNPPGSALVYSTYLGGSDPGSIAVDNAGNAYITGRTSSYTFPTTPGAFQTTCHNCVDYYYEAFVTKLNPTGSALVYSTYLGGSKNDGGSGIAVDSSGAAYVTGGTTSTDFPTMNPLQPAFRGRKDVFVTKLNSTGTALVYSTYLGGGKDDWGTSIAVDTSGNAYLTGGTIRKSFPVTPGALPTTCDPEGVLTYCGFVTKLNPAGSALVSSTYLGGHGRNWGSGVAVDSSGNVYVTGMTESNFFPTTPGALQTTCRNCLQYEGDAFVSRILMLAATTTTLTSSPNPSTYGEAVTFVAAVSSGLGTPDGGAVTFMKGATVLGTGWLSGGAASFATSALPGGTPSIRAVYGGDSSFVGSTSKALQQVVNKATTTTTLVSSQNPSNLGQAVTFTASVTPQFGGTVKGNVNFSDGSTVLKTVGVSGGAAKFTTKTLTSGTHSITATYNGSGSLIGSSASLTQTVN